MLSTLLLIEMTGALAVLTRMAMMWRRIDQADPTTLCPRHHLIHRRQIIQPIGLQIAWLTASALGWPVTVTRYALRRTSRPWWGATGCCAGMPTPAPRRAERPDVRCRCGRPARTATPVTNGRWNPWCRRCLPGELQDGTTVRRLIYTPPGVAWTTTTSSLR